MWWVIGGIIFLAWIFIFFPFNIFYMFGLCRIDVNSPPLEVILGSLLLGPFFFIIPIYFFICLLGESIGLWTVRWARYNASLQKEDKECQEK